MNTKSSAKSSTVFSLSDFLSHLCTPTEVTFPSGLPRFCPWKDSHHAGWMAWAFSTNGILAL